MSELSLKNTDGAHQRRPVQSPFVLLETDRRDSDNSRSLLFERPVCELRLEAGDDPRRFFESIDHAVAGGYWIAGYFAYELGYAFERRLEHLLGEKRLTGPLAWVGVFGNPKTDEAAGVLSDEFQALGVGQCRVSNFRLNMTVDEYFSAVDGIKSYLTAGETYQVNFTMKQQFEVHGPPIALFKELRQRQRVSFSACLFDGERTVVSVSPELFLKRDGDVIRVKPMKGTVRRGAGRDEDARLASWLAADIKNRAENVMIVDMIRNDLGRMAVPGGVRVPQLFEVERYETLFQMTSTIEADIPEDTSWFDIMQNLFPCASVTGAPKIRTMELIAALEKEPRGIYTGSIGYISPHGEACMNVAIRTMVVDGEGNGEMGIGSGVLFDSDAKSEYDECLLKAQFLTNPRVEFDLIETMRLEEGEWYLLERHLRRLQASAGYFEFRCPLDLITNTLSETAAANRTGRHKIRLLLKADGGYSVTAEPVDPPPARYRVKISSERIDPEDVHRYHKTTRRTLYQRERVSAREEGYDEVLFLNVRGELCEGTISNVFVELDGILNTPPVSCGLLPGTLREELIAQGECVENVLNLKDLYTSTRIFVGNSVLGLVEATVDG